MLAGMPSAIRRTPRTPKAERAPKPREEICSVLRVVLPVLRDQAGHGGQRLGGVDAGLAVADAGGVEHVDGGRQVEAGVADAGAADHHHLGRRGGLGAVRVGAGGIGGRRQRRATGGE
ncbi:hypothetical protein [Rugamonas sp. DEMB1]|uniref:hypothetical protein n=1 Tax=Rugamonas sp. DEMB1 TaxID=3039386 RepID=UPI0028BDAFAD|nr:hypothetical protein [Rugamonas sp. DEMB1]